MGRRSASPKVRADAARGRRGKPQTRPARRTAVRLWHWLILLVSLVGAAVSARLAYGFWNEAAAELGTDPPYLMWGLTGVAALFCIAFVYESLCRIRALRSR